MARPGTSSRESFRMEGTSGGGGLVSADHVEDLHLSPLRVTLSQRDELKTERRSGAAMARLNQRSSVANLAF